MHRADGDRRSGDEYRPSDGDCAPTQLEMEPTIADANQERLSEEEHVPGRNSEAVDQVEAEHDRVDWSATSRFGAGNERMETHEHHHDKNGARGAVEPTISFHLAPGAKFVCPATAVIERLGGVYYKRGLPGAGEVETAMVGAASK